MNLEPVEATFTECFGLRELQQSATQIGSHMVQVGWNGIQPTPEIEVVWKIYPIDLGEGCCRAEFETEVASHGVIVSLSLKFALEHLSLLLGLGLLDLEVVDEIVGVIDLVGDLGVTSTLLPDLVDDIQHPLIDLPWNSADGVQYAIQLGQVCVFGSISCGFILTNQVGGTKVVPSYFGVLPGRRLVDHRQGSIEVQEHGIILLNVQHDLLQECFIHVQKGIHLGVDHLIRLD